MDDDDTPNYYEARMDRIFKVDPYEHRSLRTVFDRWSNEWNNTTYKQKLNILTRILEAGENLDLLIIEYKERYLEQNRSYVAKTVEESLAVLLQYKLIGPHKAD